MALQTNQLAVFCLNKLYLVKTIELGDQCAEIVEVNGMVLLALKERNYWCITAELHQKLITCFYPLAQLCLVLNCVVAKTENGLVRLRPIDNYEHNALYIEDHTITVCDVFL